MNRALRLLLTSWLMFGLLFGTLSGAHVARAATSNDIPGLGPLGAGSTLNYLVSGELGRSVSPGAHLVVERIRLKKGESIPSLESPQILVAEQGAMTVTDDLGLTATFEAGTQLYIQSGSFQDLTAVEPAAILRAYVTGTRSSATITITGEGCAPTSLTLPKGTPLTIVNATNDFQFFTIPSLELSAGMAASFSLTLPISDLKPGTWLGICGEPDDRAAMKANVVITITADAPPAAATPAPIPDASVIFDQELEVTSLDNPTLFVAEVGLAGNGGSIGEQTYNGLVGMISSGQPLSITRSAHAPSTLPAGKGIFFPAGTVATVSNQGADMATVLVAGLAGTPAIAVTPPADAQPSRPTTRGGQQAEPESLDMYLPDDDAAAAAGFLPGGTDSTTEVEDSLFNGLAQEPNDGGWEAGINRVYDPAGQWGALNGALVSVDQFDTGDSAAGAMSAFALGSAIIGEPFDPPASATADQVVGFTMDVPEQSFTSTFIMAQYGHVIVTTVSLAPLNGASEPAALALWEIVDLANS